MCTSEETDVTTTSITEVSISNLRDHSETRSPEFIQLNKGLTKLGFPERDKFKKYSEIKNE